MMTDRASTDESVPATLADESALRAHHWNLLSRLLSGPPDAALLQGLSDLDGDGTDLGRAYARLAAAAASTTEAEAAREFFDLFVGVGRGELLPYASFYLTGFLNERPLADLRRDLARMGVERAAGRFEPEDHIASLCEIMAGLARGDFDAAVLGCGSAGEAGFFARHVGPWIEMAFEDMGAAPSARFYRAVAEVGRVFAGIETRAFALGRAESGQAPSGQTNTGRAGATAPNGIRQSPPLAGRTTTGRM
jgi:TorA maturation chaperone TorD